MEIIVNVIDQNDNKPVFSQDTYLGDVPESSLAGIQWILIKTENVLYFALQENRWPELLLVNTSFTLQNTLVLYG